MRARRRHLVLALFAVAMPLGMASAAFACQSLATLHANPRAVPAGVDTTLTLVGANFHLHSATAPVVDIRLDRLDGLPLARASFDSSGTFTVEVTVPGTTSVGRHTLIATLTEPGKVTTARETIQVLPPTASSSAVPFGPGHVNKVARGTVTDLATLGSPLGIAVLAASGLLGLVLSSRRTRRL